jgi:hypothetical protein
LLLGINPSENKEYMEALAKVNAEAPEIAPLKIMESSITISRLHKQGARDFTLLRPLAPVGSLVKSDQVPCCLWPFDQHAAANESFWLVLLSKPVQMTEDMLKCNPVQKRSRFYDSSPHSCAVMQA